MIASMIWKKVKITKSEDKISIASIYQSEKESNRLKKKNKVKWSKNDQHTRSTVASLKGKNQPTDAVHNRPIQLGESEIDPALVIPTLNHKTPTPLFLLFRHQVIGFDSIQTQSKR